MSVHSPLEPPGLLPTDVVELTRLLVRTRSVHDPATGSGEAAVARLVEGWMRQAGWSVTVDEVAPGRPNVIATVDGGNGPGRTLMFIGHTDVVTEGDRLAWSVDPYDAVLRDGRVYGRGAADMKGGLAAMLVAVAELVAAGPFPGRVVLAALCDEEGLMLGSKRLAATEWADGVDGVVVCEPEGGEICLVAKGAIRLRVDLTGTMAHGAMPDLGRNPIPVAAALIAAAAAVERAVRAEVGDHDLLGRLSVTPTVVQAGDPTQINVIPPVALVAFDVRTIPGVDHTQLIDTLTQASLQAAAGTGVDVRVSVLDDRPVMDTPADHPLVTALADAHAQVTGHRPRFGGVPGATDGTILARDAGLPAVVYGPGGKWIAHQADEYVEVADLRTAVRVYQETARRFLAGEPTRPNATSWAGER